MWGSEKANRKVATRGSEIRPNCGVPFVNLVRIYISQSGIVKYKWVSVLLVAFSETAPVCRGGCQPKDDILRMVIDRTPSFTFPSVPETASGNGLGTRHFTLNCNIPPRQSYVIRIIHEWQSFETFFALIFSALIKKTDKLGSGFVYIVYMRISKSVFPFCS